MQKHEFFEWDRNKAQANLRKHRVTFEDAAAMLSDELYEAFHVEEFDDAHSHDEDRYVTTGSDPMNRAMVLRVAWTLHDEVTRIITARFVTRVERMIYENQIKNRHDHP